MILKRLVLRISTALCFIAIANNSNFLDFEQQLSINLLSQKLFYSILLFRAFKRSLSNPSSFSLHLSVLLALVLLESGSVSLEAAELIILLMPPLPSNFYLTLVAPFIIPTKLKMRHLATKVERKTAICVQIEKTICILLALSYTR